MSDNNMKLVGDEWVPLTQEDIDLRAAEELHWQTVEAPRRARLHIKKMLRKRFDDEAESLGFENAHDCVSYLSSKNEILYKKAMAFIDWRDRCHGAYEFHEERLLALESVSVAATDLHRNLPIFSYEE